MVSLKILQKHKDFMMLLTLIMILMMVTIMNKNYSKKSNLPLFCSSYFSSDRQRERTRQGIGRRCKIHPFETLSLLTHFYQCLRLCSCGTKPQHSEDHHFVMTSSWEPQCHHDIIMRTPRITGNPSFPVLGVSN